MYNGIKVDGKLYKAWYSDTATVDMPTGTITIYGKNYISFPDIPDLEVENDSDIMTDYFENDRIRVTPDSIHYNAVREALIKSREHDAKKYGRR
jgi:hypothetical protein